MSSAAAGTRMALIAVTIPHMPKGHGGSMSRRLARVKPLVTTWRGWGILATVVLLTTAADRLLPPAWFVWAVIIIWGLAVSIGPTVLSSAKDTTKAAESDTRDSEL